MKMGESTRKFVWSESSHYFGANSPVRNFERNVPEESSREELVLERTVPEPSLLRTRMKKIQSEMKVPECRQHYILIFQTLKGR